MSDESRSPHEEDAVEGESDSGGQEAASKARPRKSVRAKPRTSVAPEGSETPKPPRSVVPKAAGPRSVAPRSATPKPPSVRGETPKPPRARTSRTPKPPEVGEDGVTATAGARSRRPPAVKAKDAADEPKPKAKPRARKRADSLDGDDHRFFEEGEAMAEDRHTLHSEVRDADAELHAAGLGAVDPARRGVFLRYVYFAMGACALVAVFAIARAAMSKRPAPPPATAASPSEPAASAAAVVAAAAPSASSAPAASASAAPETVASASASGSASASAAAEPSAVPDEPEKSAKEEREDARRLLEKGKTQDAIMAALRSTSLDPEDADAWLLLGGAYQTAGKSADARAAYSSCAKQAKRGELRECRLMLR